MDSESDLNDSGGSNVQTGTLSQCGIMFHQINMQKSKDFNMVIMDLFIMDDLAGCRWSMGEEENPVLIVILYYADITLKPVSKELDKVLVYCESKSLSVFIGADTNLHISLWGVSTTTIGETHLKKLHANTPLLYVMLEPLQHLLPPGQVQ
jgi:hypothetical protein